LQLVTFTLGSLFPSLSTNFKTSMETLHSTFNQRKKAVFHLTSTWFQTCKYKKNLNLGSFFKKLICGSWTIVKTSRAGKQRRLCYDVKVEKNVNMKNCLLENAQVHAVVWIPNFQNCCCYIRNKKELQFYTLFKAMDIKNWLADPYQVLGMNKTWFWLPIDNTAHRSCHAYSIILYGTIVVNPIPIYPVGGGNV